MKRKEQMEKLYKDLVALEIKHPHVEFTHPPGWRHEGWYYVEFGRSEYRFLGLDFEEAMERIADMKVEMDE
jgi:hypothetical protein